MPEELASIAQMYADAFDRLDAARRTPPIRVSFYPYIGINHTIRVRDGEVFVRISEICREMPAAGHHALAFILVAKLLRKRVPAEARRIYTAFSRSAEMRSKAVANKRSRGRKVISGAKGDFFDLEEIFDGLNRTYFAETIKTPVLSWSARRTYRILGHHDSTHDAIVISRSLDEASVPKYVVEYVVFHEMLHIHHPTVHINGRRYNHTPAFRRDERKFEYFDAAESWIENNVGRLRKEIKRKGR